MDRKLISKINKPVSYSVTLGNGVFATSLVVTAAGSIDPSAPGAAGIYAGAAVTNAKISNGGTIMGGAGGPGGAGGNAIALAGADAHVVNRGLIEGGAGGAGANAGGGIGVDLTAAGATLSNHGTIFGGTAGAVPYGTPSGSFAYAAGGAGVAFTYAGSLVNAGLIAGGAGSAAAYAAGQGGAGGAGISVAAGSSIVNHATVTGGSGGAGNDGSGASPYGFGGQGGNGITAYGALSLTNTAGGVIQGGAGGTAAHNYGGNGGIGLLVDGAITGSNHGSIFGGDGAYSGNGGNGAMFYVGGSFINAGLIAGGAANGYGGFDNVGGYGVTTQGAIALGNSGTIRGGNGASSADGGSRAGAGVDLSGGASLSNTGAVVGGNGGSTLGNSSPAGAGGGGIYINDGSLANAGQITGGLGGNGGAGGAGGVGLLLEERAAATNTGTITGGVGGAAYGDSGLAGGVGAYAFYGGTLTNAGQIFGGAGGAGSSTPYAQGGNGGAGAKVVGGLILNTGTITGGQGAGAVYGGNGGAGVVIDSGTLVSSGVILGGLGGYASSDAAGGGGSGAIIVGGTMANYGTITGGAGGLTATSGNNGAGGTGVTLSGGILINGGTINGGSGNGSGPEGYAVRLVGADCTLEVLPGAVFNGQVAADPSSNDTLILGGTSAGTLVGLGVDFTGFDTILESAGSTWTLSNAASLGSYANIEAYGVLSLDGALSGSGTIAATYGATVNLSGGGTFSGLLAGAGTLAITAATTLTAGAAIAAAYIINDAQIALGAGVDLTNGAGNVFAIDTATTPADARGHRSNPDLTGASGDRFSNTGSFVINGPNTAGIGVAFDNSGVLAVTAGTLVVSSKLYGDGTVTGGAGSLLDLGGSGNMIGGMVSTAGTLLVGGATTLTAAGGIAAAALVDMSTLALGVGVTLSNAAGDSLTLTNITPPALASLPSYYDYRGHRSNPDITGKGGRLSNAGSLYADCSGGGTIGVSLVSTGLISVTAGTLAVTAAATVGGTVSASATTLVDFAAGGTFYGAIRGAGTVEFDGATALDQGISLAAANIIDTAVITLGTGVKLDNAAGSSFTLTNTPALAASYYPPPTHRSNPDITGGAGSYVLNAGTFSAAGPGTSDVSTGFSNLGSVACTGGTLAFLGGLSNDGLITAETGLISITDTVAGQGTMAIGAGGTLSLLLGTDSTQQVDFTAATGLLELTQPLDFAGQIAGFAGGDQIDLHATHANGFTFSGGVLTVKEGANIVATLNVTGAYTAADFALSSDGHGGTFITFV